MTARFNTRRERLPGRPARSHCLAFPAFPIPTGSGSGGRLKWMMPAGFGWLPPIEITFADVSYPFEREALYAIPPRGLNNLGNPIYSWSGAVKVMDAETGWKALGLPSDEGFEWKMTGRSDDGMVYALAWSSKAGLPQDNALWMGGNVLFGFQQSNLLTPAPLGAPKWRIALPKKSVGMVPIPGGPGGVLVGIDPNRGTVGHYTKEGLLIGSMKASPPFSDPAKEPWVVGRLDAHLAVNCSRDPRDGLIDVFVEGQFEPADRLVSHSRYRHPNRWRGALEHFQQQRSGERPNRHKRNR